jgi:mono/diheme cytochrome c family protein
MRYLFVSIVALILSSMANAQAETPDVHRHRMPAENAAVSADTLKNPFSDKKRSALIGEKIFIQNCATCHGHVGLGHGNASTSVLPKPDNLTSDEIHKQSDGELFLGISNGAHGVMIPWKFVLSENQRWHLVDYIRELRKESK